MKLGVQVQVPCTYQVRIMYCKTYCNVYAKILALFSILLLDLEAPRENPAPPSWVLSLNICSLKLWYIGVVYHNQVLTIYYILFWSKVYWCELLAGIFVNKLYGCPVNYAFSAKCVIPQAKDQMCAFALPKFMKLFTVSWIFLYASLGQSFYFLLLYALYIL